jgi:hypothetical protein
MNVLGMAHLGWWVWFGEGGSKLQDAFHLRKETFAAIGPDCHPAPPPAAFRYLSGRASLDPPLSDLFLPPIPRLANARRGIDLTPLPCKMASNPQPAGYSGTPLPKKLGIKPGHRIRFVGAPPEFADALGELPAPLDVAEAGDDEVTALDLVVFFTTSADALRARFDHLASSLVPAGMLWIAWPKKASRVPTDLTEDVVRRVALERGMVDVKVCAIDATWSGLKLVYRLKDRPK